MRTFLFITVFSVLIVGCEKSQDDPPIVPVQPFVLRAGEVDADSTIYFDFLPDKELYVENDVHDTEDHFDTLDIDFDQDSVNDFSIVIRHNNVPLSFMYANGYLINNSNISFADYNYFDGLAKGDTINENLEWDNSNELHILYWSSSSGPDWTGSSYFAFKYMVNDEVKYGWLHSIFESYVDEEKPYISSFRYSLIDLAYEK